MSDGVQTLSSGLPGEFIIDRVSTDASGNINSWQFDLGLPLASPARSIATFCCDPSNTFDSGHLGPFFGTNGTAAGQPGNAGIFALSLPTSEVPLPAALPLFATGLGALGLLGWRKKMKAAALAP
jgi:hypothetical protein